MSIGPGMARLAIGKAAVIEIYIAPVAGIMTL
jgi:hypothetical protein